MLCFFLRSLLKPPCIKFCRLLVIRSQSVENYFLLQKVIFFSLPIIATEIDRINN